MNNKHRKTLKDIFKDPISPNIRWSDIESLFKHMGAKIIEAEGSRIWIKFNGKKSVFHRPHPSKVTDKGAVKSVRTYLIEIGIVP